MVQVAPIHFSDNYFPFRNGY